MRFSQLLTFATTAAAAFHHRQRSSTIVLNNILYIDNGEIIGWSKQGTGYVSNGSALGDFTFLPENNTYSIDLTTAWTNQSVTLNTIAKSAPVQVSGALWSDARGETFYAYDGGASFTLHDHVTGVAPTITPNQLWQFTPNGLSGSWSQANIAGNGSDLVRLMEITYASGQGLGFALGGLESPSTIPNLTANSFIEAVHGMVVFNMTSNTWQNVSAAYDYARGSLAGAAAFVPQFGPEGVFMALGGITDQQEQISFDNAFIYEPVSQQWAIQAVSGDKPPGSNNPCVVGIQGDNGTYEIFLYGGLQPLNGGYRIIDGSVYILSLPAFHWQKVPSTVYGRYRHTCNVAGNRQMISVGGIVFPGPLSNDSDLINGGPDPWPNGLGVFDMTDLQWTSSFQPNAAAYSTPQQVKAYYQTNGYYPSSWTSSQVQQWFAVDSKLSNTTGTSPTSSPTTQGSTNNGAIIGGAVAGGVVAVLLLLVLAYFIIRRRRRDRKPAGTTADDKPRKQHLHEKDGAGRTEVAEIDGQKTAHELDARSGLHEAPGRYMFEVDGRPRAHEIDGYDRYELDAQQKA